MAIKRRPDEPIESMLKRFKKEVLKAELVKELRKREAYIPKSEQRRIKAAAARRRAMKKARSTH